MNDRELLELAKEAAKGGPPSAQLHNAMIAEAWTPFLEKFAALVRAEREWVDLTDDEIDSVLRSYTKTDRYKDDLRSYRAVIAAFKEKNK